MAIRAMASILTLWTAVNVVIIRLNIAGMANGGVAGLCHFSGTCRSFGIKQQNGKKVWA